MNTISDKTDLNDFTALQYAFAAYIRNPQKNACPKGINPQRMDVYSDLFYRNVEDFIANAYPVLRKVLPDNQWHTIIRDYFSSHLAHTPLFPEMPREFLKYLQHERHASTDDPPFMLELAHYEWVELAISTLDVEIEQTTFDPNGDLLTGTPVISPLAWMLSYQFPVHQISPTFQPQIPCKELIHLIVYRNADFVVHFMEVNAVTARLMQLLNNTHKSCEYLLQQIAVELNHPNPEVVIQGGLEIIKKLQAHQIILGTKHLL
ncbi:DUF2063 domain-containing protein [Nitrosomonas sp. PY1]|uniref:HvfC family RiPP maturation protein n=1 Tax=Nitrosomonas sp. PY1 TaxID=1803906 RepID=UPI001FC7BDFB|nr:putative DNA-binding domain-containing protein [Nitrosomonas sp. PY1]GKS68485.1 DUF2063 domain-containing protein [Nitrosomonas sp. PY1]